MVRYLAIITMALMAGLVTTPSLATCLNPSADSRLRTYCATETASGQLLRFDDAVTIERLLRNEGYRNGIGLNSPEIPQGLQLSVYPTLQYNPNLNGGNPSTELVLGGATFRTEDAYVAQGGLAMGLSLVANARHFIGPEQYIDLTATGNHSIAPSNDIRASSGSLEICSRNRLMPQWHADMCTSIDRSVQELTSATSKDITISISNLISTNSTAFHMAQLVFYA